MTLNHNRAVRYRQLAMREPDRLNATLLYKLADEAERDLLYTSEWARKRHPSEKFENKVDDKR